MQNSIVESDEFDLETEPYVPDGETKSVAGYRILAVVSFLLAAGGLFLGALAKWADFLLSPLATGEEFVPYSLIGTVGILFRDMGSTPYDPTTALGLHNFVHLSVFLFVLAAVAGSLVLMIVSLVSRRAAERCAMFSADIVFLAYLGVFAWVFYLGSVVATGLNTGFVRTMFDPTSGMIAGAMGILLLISALARRKARALANLVFLLLTLAACFALVYPGSLNVLAVSLSAGFIEAKAKVFFALAMMFLLIVLAFNLFVSTARLGAKRAYLFDCVRFAVLLFALALFIIADVAQPIETKSEFFTADGQIMPAILLIAATVCAFLFSVLTAVLFRAKHETVEEPEADEAPAYVPEEPAEVPETEPAEAPVSEFERRMAALAKGEAPEEPAPEPVQEAMPFPAFGVRQAQPKQPSYFDPNTQYTYDPFINTLTAQEKNEFGDIFIAGKFGDLNYLPAYVIGGNNEEFFHKVFIYLGKFRKNISSELLEKLYVYISKN